MLSTSGQIAHGSTFEVSLNFLELNSGRHFLSVESTSQTERYRVAVALLPAKLRPEKVTFGQVCPNRWAWRARVSSSAPLPSHTTPKGSKQSGSRRILHKSVGGLQDLSKNIVIYSACTDLVEVFAPSWLLSRLHFEVTSIINSISWGAQSQNACATHTQYIYLMILMIL